MQIGLMLISALVTLATCLSAMRLGRALGVLDIPDPKGRKKHRHITPLVGGLAIIVPLIITSISYGIVSGVPMFWAFAVIIGGSLLVGFFDDRRHLPPSLRLLAAAFVAFAAIWMFSPFEIQFLRFSFLDIPIFTQGWGLAFTVLCLVGLQNAVNMADGKNGLVIGLSFIWVTILFYYAPGHLYPLMGTMLVCLGITLVFNLRGKLFLGDGGAYALSMAVGSLALYIYNVGFVAIPADMVALWFIIPVVDCLRLMIGRSLKGRSPFSPDREHLHHMLMRFMIWEKALVVYLAMVFVPCFLAIWLPDWTLLWVVLAMSTYLTVLITVRVLQLDQEVSAQS